VARVAVGRLRWRSARGCHSRRTAARRKGLADVHSDLIALSEWSAIDLASSCFSVDYRRFAFGREAVFVNVMTAKPNRTACEAAQRAHR
jgi:hypothetical protein